MPPTPALAVQDVRRLTLYKWTYTLENAGFTREQAARLLFWRYIAERRPDSVW